MIKEKWSNISIGGKYFIVFGLMASTFLMSIVITYLFLNNTNREMGKTLVKSEVAVHASDLIALYHEKYTLIPEYLLLAEEEKLHEYLEYSKQFTHVAKQLQQHLPEEQVTTFNQMIENNHELDQYFFSIVVPNVQQINTAEFQEIQAEVNALKTETALLGDELRIAATTFNQSAIQSAQNDLRTIIIILIFSTAISIVVSAGFLIWISRGIKNNLQFIVNRSKEIASGQLNNEELAYVGKDEIGQLSHSINVMGTNLRDMISEVSTLSSEVDVQSKTLLHSADEVKVGSEQVAITIEEMAKGSTTQADGAARISENTQDFSEDIRSVGEHSEKLVVFSKEVLQVSAQGDKQMKDSLGQIGLVNEVMESSVLKVKSLEGKTQSITEIVHVIKSIAEQTNLLALNASIEAARAGEAGKGFAVVATEVRKLAEEVTHSVENIAGIVYSIKEETTTMADELQHGYEEVNKGTLMIKETGKEFTNIKVKVEEMSEKINDVSSVFKKVETSSQHINESVENIAAISEESAAGAEEIAASVIEQSQSVDTISKSAKALSSRVDQMNLLIKRFRL
ncbi:HAMP domain-containing methyl-accepting chemotaxis protein [Alkalihalobacillus sp. LMS39]|uniref:methyl-accepting chemotaxis protein n=1 Tax=Alkalihalobacillus sp. LMS39 TaxID=2924032 RepID=UPI001FB51673|nr:HAMP domain-containing methyl-accepting chemotaxis protein [Alkalihalobacillus sp. LMS39]UOE94862.1 HAMP domain-containing methyl-accepting chemotaxis protein [Alkalihalobacillus sp. LMS39]